MSIFTLYLIWYMFHYVIDTKTKAENHKQVSKGHDEDVLKQRLKYISTLPRMPRVTNLCDSFDD